jgi:hypothetical protein
MANIEDRSRDWMTVAETAKRLGSLPTAPGHASDLHIAIRVAIRR